MPSQRHIIAMGGGGFSLEPENPSLDQYVLRQSGAARPRVCFVPTASGDADGYVANFYAAFSRLDCRPTHLRFFQRTPDLKATLLNQDVIYVGGGNTKSMLAVWRDWGADVILREAWQNGVVLAGVSAGAICWFEQGLTDSFADELVSVDCLGFIAGSCSPHYDGEADRKPSYHRMLLEQRIKPGYAIDDGAAIHFADGTPVRAVRTRPDAGAYRVGVTAGRVEEVPLETEPLGAITL